MSSTIIELRNMMTASATKQSDIYYSMLKECNENNIPLVVAAETDIYGTAYLELDFIIVPEEPELHPEEIKYYYCSSALQLSYGYTVQEAYEKLVKICEEKSWSLCDSKTS